MNNHHEYKRKSGIVIAAIFTVVSLIVLLLPGKTLSASDLHTDYPSQSIGETSIKKVTIRSKTSFIVTIKKVKDTSGYYVYDISEDGNLTKLTTIKDNFNNSFVVKGLKFYYDADGKVIKDVEHFLPKKTQYMLKVNTLKCVMTIYAKDGRKGYTIPVKSFLCSPSDHTASGTFRLGTKYRYRTLFYNIQA